MPALQIDPSALLMLISGIGDEGGTVAADLTENRNTVQLIGGAMTSKNRSKFYDSSIYMDGANDYVAANDVSSLLVDEVSYTMGGWFYMNALMSGQNSLFGFHTSGNSNRFVVTREYIFGSTGVSTDWYTTPFEIGAWRHVMVVVTRGVSAKVYFDGVEVLNSILTGTGGRIYDTDKFSIGQEWDSSSPTDFMQGNVQDFFIAKGALVTTDFTPPERLAGSIVGVIRDEYGRPAVRRVILTRIGWPAPDAVATESSSTGVYSFNGLPLHAEYTVVAVHKSLGTLRGDIAIRGKPL